MASNVNEIDTKVVRRIKDGDGKLGGSAPGASPERLEAIAAAVSEYQRSFPREVVVELTGAGSFDFAVAALTGFVVGFSAVTQIRYPYTAGDQLPDALEADQFSMVQLPAGWFLRLFDATPSAAQKLLVYFTAPHTLAATSTIPAAHDDALADLAASNACGMLAAAYAQTTEGTMQADSVNRGSRVDYYRGLAKDYRRAYETKLGLGKDAVVGAGIAVADMNPPFSGGRGERLLFHD